MLELDEARDRILALIEPLPAETISLSQATGRIVAEKIDTPIDLPPFDSSAMDGYAVCASDLSQAGPDRPVSLRLSGQVAAGEVFQSSVKPGNCVRVFTGSALPEGADAVVMQEETRWVAEQGAEVLFLESIKPWGNVRLRGEDVRRGGELVSRGARLTVGRIGLLAACGIGEISVHRQPIIGVLATGSELREAGAPLLPGQIYESNRVCLASLLRQAGAIPRLFPLIEDTLEETGMGLQIALAECDGVVTTGGVSVGAFDWVKEAFEQLGGTLDFWKVAMKPGKPFAFGRYQDRFLFGLPGNPVSAFVSFLLLARPALLRLQGADDVLLPRFYGILAEPVVNRGERRHFMRVTLNPDGKVRLAGAQASHILSSLAAANGLVDVPAGTNWEVDTPVTVMGWD